MSNKKLLAIATGAALLAGAQGASAGVTPSGTANYDITLTASCSLVVNGASFGTRAVEAADLQNEPAGTVAVTCSNGTPYAIMFDSGANLDATTGARTLKHTDGVNAMVYELLNDQFLEVGDLNPIDPAYQPVNQNYPASPITATGTGAQQVHSLYANVFISTSRFAGTYTDSVGVTVTF